MKSQYRMFFFFVAVLAIVSLACGGSGAAPAGDSPTLPPPPTAVPPTAAPPTAAPQNDTPQQGSSGGEQFFTEEFDQDPGSDWVVDIIGPGAEAHKDSVKTEFSNSKMRVELPNEGLYYYYSYLGSSYADVRVDLRADNRGVNTNNVSLFCRSGDDGWYEWSVSSGGLWILYAVTDGFNTISNGGTNALKQGKDVNEYSLICKGNQISMFVNGEEVKQSPVTDTKYALREGGVGFNISSLNVIPVIVEVDWFKISEP